MKPLKSQIKIDADLLLTSFIDAIILRLHQKYKTFLHQNRLFEKQ